MSKLPGNQKGFTLIEWLITFLIFSSLIGISAISLSRLQSRTSVDSALDVFVSDFKRQQSNSMTLNKTGEADTVKYGVSFEPDKYFLFKGNSALSDPNKKQVNLDSNLVFEDISFSDWTIIFLKGSGEVENFLEGNDSINLKDKYTGERRLIRINKYGIIEEVSK